jgi:hypothetical protein
MHADIELDLGQPVTPERPARLPWGVLIAVVLFVAVLYLRQPVPAGASSAESSSRSGPPSTASAAISAGPIESFSVDSDAHSFTMSFFVTTSSVWPLTMTGVRLALPVGLSQTAPPRLVAAWNPGRPPAATVVVQLTARTPVQVVIGLSVRCDQLYSVTLGRVLVLASIDVAGHATEHDVAARYVMEGWPWSAALAAQACDLRLGRPPMTSNRVFGSDGFGGSVPLGVFGPWGGSGPPAGSSSGSVSGTTRRR